MEIKQIFTQSPLRNFSYLIIGQDHRRVVCIDPYDSDSLINFCAQENLIITDIVNTHEHWDHTKGNAGLSNHFKGCKIWAHANGLSCIEGATQSLKANDRLEFSEHEYLQVLDTPGHTFAHVCLLSVSKGKVTGVFSGDTLFNAGVGNCRNGGDPNILYETISQQFGELSDDVIVYPGHDYMENNLDFTLSVEPENQEALHLLDRVKASDGNFIQTQMGDERKFNTFLRLQENSVRKGLEIKFPSATFTDKKNTFLKLRQLRDQW